MGVGLGGWKIGGNCFRESTQCPVSRLFDGGVGEVSGSGWVVGFGNGEMGGEGGGGGGGGGGGRGEGRGHDLTEGEVGEGEACQRKRQT